jgi:hypothetical protein
MWSRSLAAEFNKDAFAMVRGSAARFIQDEFETRSYIWSHFLRQHTPSRMFPTCVR